MVDAAADRRRLALIGALALVTAVAIAALDQPVARWVAGYQAWPGWTAVVDVLEWGLGLPLPGLLGRLASVGALAAIMLACVLVPRWRPHAPTWMLLAGTHIFARFATGQLKDATARLRPHQWLERGGDSFFRDGASFPSGHVALFASVLVPVAMLWPRTRPLLAIVGFVMLARIADSAHFVSDTTGALALVAIIAAGLAALLRR